MKVSFLRGEWFEIPGQSLSWLKLQPDTLHVVAGRRGPRLSSGCRCSGGRTCGRDPTPCTAGPLHQVRRRRVDGGVPGISGRYTACTIIYFDGCIYVLWWLESWRLFYIGPFS